MRFPSTRRERGGGKKREAREHAHVRIIRTRETRVCMRSRVCMRTLHGVRTGRKRTYVQKEARQLRREIKTERERGKRGRQGDGSCVCTTRRVYQATSVVTAIVPTTSPAGRHPRSIRLSSVLPCSLTSSWIPSVSPRSREHLVVSSSSGRGRSYPHPFLKLFSLLCPKFLASLPFSSLRSRCDKRLYFRAKSEFLG